MALSRQQKEADLKELEATLADAKMVVFAGYQGLSVQEAEELRRMAKAASVRVRVFKNRLVKKALTDSREFASADTSSLKGQLVYAFSSEDEVAPAQLLKEFSKGHPAIELRGGFDRSGETLDQARVETLASLPSKDAMRAQLVGTIAAPLRGMLTVLRGNVTGLINVLNAASKE